MMRALVQTALCSAGNPGAPGQVERSRVALCLARADRIPIPSVGPVYEKDESGSSFYGMTVSTPIPVWNAGGRLVTQREAEYHRDTVAFEQTQQRVIVQVKTSAARWNHAQQLAARTTEVMRPLQDHEARMERLFTAGQTDLVKLLQVRQRWLDGPTRTRYYLGSHASLCRSAGVDWVECPFWPRCRSRPSAESNNLPWRVGRRPSIAGCRARLRALRRTSNQANRRVAAADTTGRNGRVCQTLRDFFSELPQAASEDNTSRRAPFAGTRHVPFHCSKGNNRVGPPEWNFYRSR